MHTGIGQNTIFIIDGGETESVTSSTITRNREDAEAIEIYQYHKPAFMKDSQ
jgi:hypothetical protein